MKNLILIFLLGAVFFLSGCLGNTKSTSKTQSNLTPTEAREIAKEAYVFCFPMNYYYRTIYAQVIDPDNQQSLGGFGKWRHDVLALPTSKETTMSNRDTHYSWAWVDLRSEPWVLVQPPADGDRFYSSVWADLFAHIIDYPGSTNDGQEGGTYLLAPTTWKGELPKGIKRVIYGETTLLGTLTRTAVFSDDDVPNAMKIQQGYQLMPLSSYLHEAAPTEAPNVNWPVWNEENMTNAEFFKLANFLFQFVIPNEMDKSIYEKMAKLGIGPNGNYDTTNFSPEILAAINEGVTDGYKEISDGARTVKDGTKIYGNREFMGTRYLDLAVGVEGGGLIPNTSDQCFYGNWGKDAEGALLDGSKANYTFTFPKGQIPPVRFFWSLTLYDGITRLLVQNDINRYSIGDRTKGLKYNSDGSLTIYVQYKSPGKDKEGNWLPAPNGPMQIAARMYGPKPAIVKGEWKFPEPVKVE